MKLWSAFVPHSFFRRMESLSRCATKGMKSNFRPPEQFAPEPAKTAAFTSRSLISSNGQGLFRPSSKSLLPARPLRSIPCSLNFSARFRPPRSVPCVKSRKVKQQSSARRAPLFCIQLHSSCSPLRFACWPHSRAGWSTAAATSPS